jgi:protein-S-isoprenylcysteine O-methyltransferase Ste14
MAGYALMCSHGPQQWMTDIETWRAIAGVLTSLVSIVIFWGAVASLGKQWRFDAGLNKEHELVQTGAYRVVRHPIYASMFGMLIATGFFTGTLPGWPIAIVLFIIGTEIRVRVEDGLLRARFGQRFIEWQKAKAAYVPFVR